MHAKFVRRALAALAFGALCISPQLRPLEAQTPTVTLTITTDGTVSGAVGVQGPNGNVCNPNPGGGGGGGTCVFTYPVNTPLRMAANSPNTPGNFHDGTGDTAACAKSTCDFTLTSNSSIIATFTGSGHPSLTIDLLGDGKGNVGADNNQCQNFELGFTSCTTFYVAGSQVKLQGRSMPGNLFERFSNGTDDAVNCTSSHPNNTCTFTLSSDSTLDATFSKLSSVAIDPTSRSISVGGTAFFNAIATFTNGMTRPSFNGNSPWQSHVPMDVARFSLAAAVVNDRLYAIGGTDGPCPSEPCPFGPLTTVEVFDPLVVFVNQFDQAWTPVAPMSTPREGPAAAVVDGTIYALGGHTTDGPVVASMESYDPATNTWTGRAPMSTARAGMAAAVIGNTIYVVGGNASHGGAPVVALNTVEAYDAVSNSWITPPPPAMLAARAFPAAAAVNGTLYVIGGDATGSVEAYDGTAWSMKAPMPGGGGLHRAVALNGLIYAVGGSPVEVKVYNPALDSWLRLTPSFPLPVSGHFALAVLDGRLFAAGGNNLADNTALSTLSAHRPPEATWWSNNSAVGRVNTFNSGSVQGVAAGTATISARLVDIDSDPDGVLTVTAGGGGGSQIFVNGPNQAFTEVGQANWGCGTFLQNNSTGPWQATVNYGEGGGNEPLPLQLNPPPGTCFSPSSTGAFFFNHAYSSPGTFHVVVTVRNTATNVTGTKEFDVLVEEPEPEDCAQIVSTIDVIGTVPFDRVHVAVFDRVTGDLLTDPDTALPLGFFDEAALPAGQYRFEFSVPDGYMVTPSTFIIDAVCGQPIILNATVQAIPSDPPTLSVALSPDDLWPANNRMVDVTATITAASPYGNPLSIELVSITSSDGNEAGDIAHAALGTDDRAFELRAQRGGGSAGRTYTVTYRVTDTVTGLSAGASATATVPHDRRR